MIGLMLRFALGFAISVGLVVLVDAPERGGALEKGKVKVSVGGGSFDPECIGCPPPKCENPPCS